MQSIYSIVVIRKSMTAYLSKYRAIIKLQDHNNQVVSVGFKQNALDKNYQINYGFDKILERIGT